MKSPVVLISCGFWGLLVASAQAQSDAPPPDQSAPAAPEPPAEQPPAEPPEPTAPAGSAQAPEQSPPPAAPGAAGAPATTTTPPADAAAVSPGPAPAPAPASPPPPAAKSPEPRIEENPVEEPPPPPPPPPDRGSSIPPFSVRVDPFNWLIGGRLGLELEAGVWKFISAELVPVFVTSESPPWFNFSGRDKALTQHSNGLGPISGASLGVGFWFQGKPLEGTLLRAIYTNYGYKYESQYTGGSDSVKHTERHLGVTLGSYNRYGAFIIGAEIGLSKELNDQERCLDPNDPAGCGKLELRGNGTLYDLDGPFHPIYLEGRFSLGVAIDPK
ncbi:MAG TPA: hypothetical protein VL137_14640 [Polyangiaceae bacterium]|nr:hypothetical protein [Polyangiaceae bacterium]